jgi:hypothetical protein
MEADQLITRPPPVHRVKIYKLDDKGEWIACGTGFISVAYLEVRRQLTWSSCSP